MERRLGFFYDPVVLKHVPPSGHPERPARIQTVVAHLKKTDLWARLMHLPVVPATREQLLRVHTSHYLDHIHKVVGRGGGTLDAGDTVASPGSWAAAVAAAGAGIGAVDAVLTSACEAAFAVVRPPGHHAPSDRAMGFCLLSNAAVAAAHAIAAYGLSRVLVVDFDVHHGNGTQDIFYSSDQVLYFSTHQSPAYPGTGRWDETGRAAGTGFTVNVPLPPDVEDSGFYEAFSTVLRPIAARYQPELIIASAGYDAHWRSSAYVNGIRERVTISGFSAFSDCLREMADDLCPGRLVGILEGGYDLESLALGVEATLRSWIGDGPPEDTLGPAPQSVQAPDISFVLSEVRRIHGLV